MENLITTVLISLATMFAGAFSGWFFGRKKQHIETIDYALATWQKVVDSLELRINVMLEEARGMRERVRELEGENKVLREQLSDLRLELATFKNLQRKITSYESKVKEYEEKIIAYERLCADHNVSLQNT